MITRRSFLAALACLPIVGKYVPKPKTFLAYEVNATKYASMADRPGHSVFVCPFGLPLGRLTNCACKHHELHRQFVGAPRFREEFSVSDWYTG